MLRYSAAGSTEGRMSFRRVLEAWKEPQFVEAFCECLSRCPFQGFRWETPCLNESNLAKPFEFVLLEANRFADRRSDSLTYSNYFDSETPQLGAVAFKNLSGDAMLIVPTPQTKRDIYGHLAAFVRGASAVQLQEFWGLVATRVCEQMDSKPLWLSTAGGGVAWLHARIDSSPKYYGYAPYRNTGSGFQE